MNVSRIFKWSVLLALAVTPTTLYGQVLGIDLTFESVGGSLPVAGAGTSTASLNFGTVSAFQPVGGTVTRTLTASDYTMSTQFAVRVTKGVLVFSSNYTLRGRLTVAQPLTWKLRDVTMSTSFATVATSQPYASPLPHPVAFTIPFSAASGAISTTLEVLAIAN